jgi:hypothetical protein
MPRPSVASRRRAPHRSLARLEFAPNAALDLEGFYLFAGDALETAEVLNGVRTRLDPHDAHSLAPCG